MDTKVQEVDVHQCVNSSKLTMPARFDEQLLDHIRNGRNDEAMAMLTKELAQAFDDSSSRGTLLQHAAARKNAVIARTLIELGADVNRHQGPTTPLVIAVKFKSPAVVQVLLEAGALIDVVDDSGSSALNTAFDSIYFSPEIVEIMAGKLRMETGTNEKLAERLIAANCNMHHAAKLKDVDLMECMLKHGVDVNSKSHNNYSTALHSAVEMDEVNLASWLLNKGLDVDAVNGHGLTALLKAAESGNVTMVKFLLKHGACPDVKEGYEYTPLYAAFLRLNEGPDETVECVELLLQHGATLPNCGMLRRMFYIALDYSCDKAVKLLIAHLAMLEMLGKPVAKSVLRSNTNDSFGTKMSELWKYYEPCQQILTIEVFEKLSLLDLLNESDRKMRLLVRKETLFQEVEKICSQHKLSELYPYYYNSMIRRIEKANQVVQLEDEAILVICKIFEANYNQIYDFAKGVVEYLNERDLERLIQV